MNRMMAPFAAPTKVAGLQGKKPQGSGGPCLWGQQWTRLAFFLAGAGSTATTGAWPSPRQGGPPRRAKPRRVWPKGPRSASWPPRLSLRRFSLQGKRPGVRDPRRLGAAMSSSA